MSERAIHIRYWRLKFPLRWRLIVKFEAWRQPREADLPTISELQEILAHVPPDEWYDRSKEDS